MPSTATTRKTASRGHLRVAASRPSNVEERLRKAFPEINFDRLISPTGPNNHHNVMEQWGKTVGSVQDWIARSRS